uniref:Polymerase n=2 Tax=Heligmosomoides polygyrus TaxID=6339 RepID=A0A183G042_HELPZ
LGLRPKPSTQPPRPSYSLRPGARQRTSQQRLGIGLSLKRHPFSGLVDSAAGTDFHGHRPAVYINQRLLWGLMSEKLGTLTQRLVHPTAPVLLTKNGPLGARSFAPIPKSIDRFARQNRYGLPPEFPLTSSCSGIVHHLSGRNLYALPLPICKQTRQGHGAPLRKRNGSHVSRLTDLYFHYALGFSTL